MGTVGRQPCTRLASNMNIISLFCLAFCPSIVFGLVFDPFRSLLLSLKGSVGNDTIDQEISDHTFGFVPQIVRGQETKVYGEYTLEVLKRKIADFAPVTVTTDVRDFTETDTKVLELLIKAAKYMNPIFNRQMFR